MKKNLKIILSDCIPDLSTEEFHLICNKIESFISNADKEIKNEELEVYLDNEFRTNGKDTIKNISDFISLVKENKDVKQEVINNFEERIMEKEIQDKMKTWDILKKPE